MERGCLTCSTESARTIGSDLSHVGRNARVRAGSAHRADVAYERSRTMSRQGRMGTALVASCGWGKWEAADISSAAIGQDAMSGARASVVYGTNDSSISQSQIAMGGFVAKIAFQGRVLQFLPKPHPASNSAHEICRVGSTRAAYLTDTLCCRAVAPTDDPETDLTHLRCQCREK